MTKFDLYEHITARSNEIDPEDVRAAIDALLGAVAVCLRGRSMRSGAGFRARRGHKRKAFRAAKMLKRITYDHVDRTFHRRVA